MPLATSSVATVASLFGEAEGTVVCVCVCVCVCPCCRMRLKAKKAHKAPAGRSLLINVDHIPPFLSYPVRQ
jgi:hypothetical protein